MRVASNPSGSVQNADSAYALNTYAKKQLPLLENKITYNDRTYSVIDGGSRDIQPRMLVKMAGQMTNSQGFVIDNDVTVGDGIGVLNDQVLVGYRSVSGDSGAPVFIDHGRNTVKIVGQHVGKFCFIDLNSGS